jgi:hypothetical protein
MSKLSHPAFMLLGHRVRDVVTDVEGVVESVCFDLYGCIQASVRTSHNDKEGVPMGFWYDIKRLIKVSKEPVLVQPDFSLPEIGAANKPSARG